MNTTEPKPWLEKVSERSMWLLKHLWAPTIISAGSVLVVAFGLFVNTWVGSQNTVIQSLKADNDFLRERCAGLLQEIVWTVDTLRCDTTLGGDQKTLDAEFTSTVRVQGGRVEFRFWKNRIPRGTPPFEDGMVSCNYRNDIEGIPAIEGYRSIDSAGTALKRSVAEQINLSLGKDRFEFVAEGRRYYLYCERAKSDRLAIVASVIALDPIYRPSLGVPKK
jgi:hypothetical protein